jgi:hypothetical protein
MASPVPVMTPSLVALRRRASDDGGVLPAGGEEIVSTSIARSFILAPSD